MSVILEKLVRNKNLFSHSNRWENRLQFSEKKIILSSPEGKNKVLDVGHKIKES